MVGVSQNLRERNAAIPEELKNLHQWARCSPDKAPLNLDGSLMDWGDTANWLSFEQVSRFDRIGCFITPESGIIGVDFDGCIDENGVIHPLVKKYIDQAHTWAETSQSKKGLKLRLRAKLQNDKAIKNKNVPWAVPDEEHVGIELYGKVKFFAVTGDIIPGCPLEINEAPEVLNDILVRFGPAPKVREKVTPELTNGSWDFNAWVVKHLDVIEMLADGYIITCPWSEEHTTTGDTARIWTSPKHTFNCFHAHCSGREWSDVRLKYEPTAYDRRDAWSDTVPYNPTNDHSSNGNGNGHAPSNEIQPDLETIIQRLGENEYGDGLLFAQAFNGQVCYDHSEKAWYLWNKHHWKKDATGKIKQLVSGHLGSIYLKARGDVHKLMVNIQLEMEKLQKENSEDEKIPKLKASLAR